jgi:hypothetical protein
MAQAMPVANIVSKTAARARRLLAVRSGVAVKHRRSRARLDNTLTAVLKARSSTRHQYYRRILSCQVSSHQQNVESKKKVSGRRVDQRKSLRNEWTFRQ